MALIAEYRVSEPNGPPAHIRVFLGCLSLVVRPIHRDSHFWNHRYGNPRISGLSFSGFNCFKKNTQPNHLHSRITNKRQVAQVMQILYRGILHRPDDGNAMRLMGGANRPKRLQLRQNLRVQQDRFGDSGSEKCCPPCTTRWPTASKFAPW